jgi:sulfatase maturation enzyme AslB (radical SAM superfamily)
MIQFAWDIHFSCNYSCPYCWFAGKWDEIKVNNIYPGEDKLLNIWKRIYDKYGRVHIEIAGGEPLTYPGFTKFIIELSKIHEVGITSNLSTDIDELVNRCEKVNIAMSYHPLFADFDDFTKKALKIKDRGFGKTVLYLAYPPQIDKIPHYKKIFEEQGFYFSVLTFWGKFENKDYPLSYTKKEKEIIDQALGVRGETNVKYQVTPKATKGKMCNAGKTYALVHPNGNAYRCGGGNWKDQHKPFGNIFESDFALLEKPSECGSENCPCNEWSFLLEKKEML